MLVRATPAVAAAPRGTTRCIPAGASKVSDPILCRGRRVCRVDLSAAPTQNERAAFPLRALAKREAPVTHAQTDRARNSGDFIKRPVRE